jgi:hypothetical protein
MAGRDFFAEAQIRRFSQGRKHAETAIELAIMACEAQETTEAQLADLADAVDAFKSGQHAVAVVLAEAAIEGRHKTRTAIRPQTMARSLADLKAILAEIAQQGAAGHHQDF